MKQRYARPQGGAALVVSLIMLVLVTLVVITALNIGSSNFRAVSNTQFRDEAIAAAELAIQDVISSDFAAAPAAQEGLEVDLNGDDVADYVVDIAVPQCIFASQASDADPSSLALPGAMTAASTWNTVWDIDATVAPAGNVGGAAVRIRTGVRVLLDQADLDIVCP
jgi:type II secretory pathway pseudopilin PulG